MKTIRKLLWLNLVLFLIFVFSLIFFPIKPLQAKPQPDELEHQESILVGRISHVQGELLRYEPEHDTWVATIKDEPFYTDDLFRCDEDGRAEFIAPNNTWIRADHNTRIEVHVLRDDLTEISVEYGLARFYNKGSYAVIKAITPFGYVMAPEETTFDLYVGPDSVEVIALKGNVDFFHNTSETRYQVIAGEAAILADSPRVTAALGEVDSDWDWWNQDREDLWATRGRLGEDSEIYLPPTLHYEAYALETHGRWERVYYNGAYSYFWRPLYVGAGWAPFTVGRWTVCYGEHVWLPCEPFGYVTHHYGNWVFVRGLWYWAPPVARIRVRVGLPLLDIGFAWYPGRVAWIHSGVYIGWVPLAPYEPYYCHRRWGPRTVVVKNVNIKNIDVKKYTYIRHSVVINKSKIYNVKNYTKVRVRHKEHGTLARNYRFAPVLNNKIVKNYKNVSRTRHFKNAHVKQTPDGPANDRIRQHRVAPGQRLENKARILRRDVPDARKSRHVGKVDMRSQKSTGSLGRSNHVDRRLQKTDFRKTEQRKKPRTRIGTGSRLDSKKDMRIIRTREPVKPARQQMDNKRQMQTVRTRPVNTARQQTRQEEKQRHTGSNTQRKSAFRPAKPQEVPVEKADKEEQRNKEESRMAPWNNLSAQGRKSHDTRTTGQHTRQERHLQQSQPRQQRNTWDAEKGRSKGRWHF